MLSEPTRQVSLLFGDGGKVMSVSADSGTRYSFTWSREPWVPIAFGVFSLAIAGVMLVLLGAWYLELRKRARAEDSWWREAERLTAIYEAHARDPGIEKPGPGDPLAQNHRKMAQLLAGGRRGRWTSDPSPWYYVLLVVVIGGAGVYALVSGLSGLRALARGAVGSAAVSGSPGCVPGAPPPAGPSSRSAAEGAAPDPAGM
jgi:hypothetical protein